MRSTAVLLAVVAVLAFNACAAETEKTEEKKSEPKKESKAEGKDASAELKPGKSVEGTIGCARCCYKTSEVCAPALKIGDKVYLMKPTDKADAKTRELIAKCEGNLTAKKVKVKGELVEDKDHKHWYYVGELLMDM